MSKLDIVFCDLDGTILDDKLRHYNCYRDIVRKFGGVPIGIEEYWEDKRSMVKRTVLLEKTKFQGTYQQYLDDWLARIEEKHYLSYEILKPKSKETLEFLRTKSDKVILVTMRQKRDALLQQLQELKILSCFDEIIVGNALFQKKS